MRKDELCTYSGAGDPGGSGVGPLLELEVYVVKISKIRKFNYFFSIGPPMAKNVPSPLLMSYKNST